MIKIVTEKINGETYYLGKNDRAFKEIFLNPKNQRLLKILLESILNVKINDIKYEPTERNTNNLKIRRKTLDCLLNTSVGLIGIEVNTSMPPYIKPRNFSFACDMYKAYTTKGNEYSEDINIIQINLSYGLPKSQERIREYKVQDDKGNLFIKNFKIVEINMDLYNKKWYDLNRKNMTSEEKNKNLSLIMIGEIRENLEELSKENNMVGDFMEEIDKINNDPVFRWSISEEKDKEMIFNSQMRYAKETGLAKGLAKGMKQGIEQGIEQGLKEGKQQGLKEGSINKSIEIAKNLMNMNMTLKDISKATDISIEELKKLS